LNRFSGMTSESCLLTCEVSPVGLCFSVLFQLRCVINTWVRELKGAVSTLDVSRDVDHAGNFGQIASDRGGTTFSVHVWHFEANKSSDVGVIRRCLRDCGDLVIDDWSRNRGRRPRAPYQRE